MTNTAIESAFLNFKKRKDELESNLKEFVRIVLEETPGNTIDLSENPAYCTDSNGIDYYEERVYGVRLNDKNIEVTLLCTDGKADWNDIDYIRSEYSHHCTINWFEVIDSIRFTV